MTYVFLWCQFSHVYCIKTSDWFQTHLNWMASWLAAHGTAGHVPIWGPNGFKLTRISSVVPCPSVTDGELIAYAEIFGLKYIGFGNWRELHNSLCWTHRPVTLVHDQSISLRVQTLTVVFWLEPHDMWRTVFGRLHSKEHSGHFSLGSWCWCLRRLRSPPWMWCP
jgi:hypothetical protein